jgi:hypothetical protein
VTNNVAFSHIFFPGCITHQNQPTLNREDDATGATSLTLFSTVIRADMRFFRIYVLLSCLLTSWEAQALELLFHVSALPLYVKDDPRQGLVPEIVTRAFATQGIQCRFIRSNNKRMETEVEAELQMRGLPEFRSITRKFFSDPVIEFENVAVTLSDKHLQINSLSDLSGKKSWRSATRKKCLVQNLRWQLKPSIVFRSRRSGFSGTDAGCRPGGCYLAGFTGFPVFCEVIAWQNRGSEPLYGTSFI